MTFAPLSFSKDAYFLDLVMLWPLLVCNIIRLLDPPPNRWKSWRGGAKRQVTFQSLTPVPTQPWSMEDMIYLDFNIVLGTKGGVLVTTSALKTYTLKLEMATSIFINSLVHESRYIISQFSYRPLSLLSLWSLQSWAFTTLSSSPLSVQR